MGVSVIEDAVDKRLRQMREERRGSNFTVDRTAVDNRDPAKHYRWANKKQRQHREQQGYVATEVAAKGKPGVKPKFTTTTADGAFERGDLMLMETPVENFIERSADQRYRQERMEVSSREQATENINKMYRDEVRGSKPHSNIVIDDSKEK